VYLGALKVCHKLAIYTLLLGVFVVCGLFINKPAHATAGINQQINFQGRLLNSQGATAPDGYYNIEFKIYQDGDGQSIGDTTGSPAGSLKWTEDYLNVSSHGVMVKNGFMSVNLGSITPFGASIDWNQDTLWLSLNIGNTNASCTPFSSCSPDTEMIPMKRMSSTPYALNAGLLGGVASTGFVQLAQGVQTDASTNTNSIYINKTNTGNLITLQSSGSDAFTINNTGDIAFGANANHTLSVTTAGAGVAGKSMTVTAGAAGTGGSALAGGDLLLQGGAAGGTNSNGGNVALDSGVKSGSGTDGNISIGTSHASTIQIGSTTLASGTQTVNLGTNNTSGSTTNVTIGAGGTATGGTTTLQAKGNVTIGTNGTTRGTFDTSNNLYLGNGVTAAAPNNFVVSGTGSSTTGVAGGTMNIQGGNATVGNANGGNVTINSGALFGSGADGTVSIGNTHASTIQIGNTSLSSGTQAVNIGNNNTSGGTTNVTIGSGSSATAGTTAIQSKDNMTLSTGTGGTISFNTAGSTRATFSSTAYGLYLGAGITGAVNPFTVSAAGGTDGIAGSGLTVQGGVGGTTSGAGGTMTVQGGNATAGNSNGGNLSLNAGSASGSGTVGTVSIGASNLTSIQVGNTTIAGTQTIAIGNNNTASSTTNVTIGSGSSATGGTTAIQSKGAMTLNSGSTVGITSATNASMTATAGTMGITSSGNSSIAATAGTFSTSSSGNTTITSTAGTVGLVSSGATTFTTNGAVRGTFDSASYGLYLGAGVTGAVNPFTLSSSGGTAGVAGSALTVQGGAAGSSSVGGALNLQGGAGGSTTGAGGAVAVQGGSATAGNSNGGNLSLNAGNKFGTGVDGNINIGNLNNANTIQVGNTSLAAGIQAINIGTNNTAGGTTNVTIGSGSAAAGTTTVQSRDNMSLTSSNGTMGISSSGNSSISSTAGTIALSSLGNTTISTNSVARATFDNAGNLYLGNGVTAGTPSNFAINGTGSTTTAVAGSTITIQGGNATVGNAGGGIISLVGGTGYGSGNGGNLTLSGGTGGGTGVNGLVVLTTPTFSTTANDANCYPSGALAVNSCTFAATTVNNSSAALVGFTTTGKTATLPDPTTATAGRVIYITAANTSSDFTLSVNGGGAGNTIAMRQNTTATMIWNGADWTAAGASSSTTLQSAYDNTLQSAGGAELVVSHTSNTNGLTIRDSTANPVNGTLLSVQNSTAAGLFSVNSNASEYATDGGAETAGGTASTFPASTWAANGASSPFIRYTTTGSYIATGQASVATTTSTAAQDGAKDTLASALTANMHYNVSFTARLASGTFTDMNVNYSPDGTNSGLVSCLASKAIITSVWTKVNCTFAAPSSGITASNAIFIRQTSSGTARTFYIDNLSVAIAADYNLATDGGVDDSGNFATNWSFVNATSGAGSVARNTSDGQAASDSAGVTLTTGAANAGIRNKLSMNPLTSTLYRITTYAKLSSGTFTDFKVRYSRDGSTGSSGNYVDCVDYNTQTITTTGWTQITCYITTDGTAATNPYVNFVETASATRTFYVDTFSMNLSTNTTPNVQIGGGVNGGPVTLLTLDRGASAPIASNNDSLLGSMYYDTTLGKLQCYEADGWGACGSSPDNVITISPEFTNAVLHGTGVGTMTSDICSATLGINDGTSGQPTICGANQTYNFYQWTSPQTLAQTYSIYVTYQLPTTFKAFTSGATSVMGRTDNGANGGTATLQYTIFKNNSSGLTTCNSTPVTVSTGTQTTWQPGTATGTADPSTCGFAPSDSIIFKIDTIANKNALVYVANLNFIFSNK
jgi:hypothetical protein